MPFQIFEATAHSILSPVSGFLTEAGFTHSLSPSRNCTYGCSYCYVPTLGVYGGLRPEDWKHWGEWTTFKRNAAELLVKSLRPDQVIYCSPLTDPYQPAEREAELMPGILRSIAEKPPKVFVIQTRGPLILRDLELLKRVAAVTTLRVGFSVTTNREEVRRIFEPHCASIEERWATVKALQGAGIATSATIAPILPCDPEELMRLALAVSKEPVIADPLHVRAVKRTGAVTRDPAFAICARYGWEEWLDPEYQHSILLRMAKVATAAGREFGHGPAGFGLLAGNIEGTRGVL